MKTSNLARIKKNGIKFGDEYYLFKEGDKYFLYHIERNKTLQITDNPYGMIFEEEFKKLDKILRKRKLRKLLK